jgi:YgiT-type zinc finger domain-containing protein
MVGRKTKGPKCPTCGKLMVQRVGDVVFPLAKKVKVEGLHFLECDACGEKVFDHDAQVKIEAAIHRNK